MRVLCGGHPCRWEFGTVYYLDSSIPPIPEPPLSPEDEAQIAEFERQDAEDGYVLAEPEPSELAVQSDDSPNPFADDTWRNDGTVRVGNGRFFLAVDLGSGWVKDGELWRLSTYALRRVRRQQSPKFRRETLTAIESDDKYYPDVEYGQHAEYLHSFPVRAQCPLCGMCNIIDPDRLHLRWPSIDAPLGSVHFTRAIGDR